MNEILLRCNIGGAVTSLEETILGYAYYAAGEQAARLQVGQDTETNE